MRNQKLFNRIHNDCFILIIRVYWYIVVIVYANVGMSVRIALVFITLVRNIYKHDMIFKGGAREDN